MQTSHTCLASGHGRPINDLDNQCRILAQGYKCVIMDDPNDDCKPWDVQYTRSGNLFFLDISSIQDFCKQWVYEFTTKIVCHSRANHVIHPCLIY